jgi:hypothetical protein
MDGQQNMKIFVFKREEVTGNRDKNCMIRDLMILPSSTNIIPGICNV